jgi:hypothetical protein
MATDQTRKLRLRPLAAVAVILAVAGLAGAWGLGRLRRGEAPVVRGGDSPLRVLATWVGDSLRIDWNVVPSADLYVIRMSTPDGVARLERQTSSTSLTLPRAEVPRIESKAPLYGTVEALDAQRRTVVRSIAVPIVAPGEGPP